MLLISQMRVAHASLPCWHKGNLLPLHTGFEPLSSATTSFGMGWFGQYFGFSPLCLPPVAADDFCRDGPHCDGSMSTLHSCFWPAGQLRNPGGIPFTVKEEEETCRLRKADEQTPTIRLSAAERLVHEGLFLCLDCEIPCFSRD